MDPQAYLVGHRPAGNPQRCLFAGYLGDSILQVVDRGITRFVVHVIKKSGIYDCLGRYQLTTVKQLLSTDLHYRLGRHSHDVRPEVMRDLLSGTPKALRSGIPEGRVWGTHFDRGVIAHGDVRAEVSEAG